MDIFNCSNDSFLLETDTPILFSNHNLIPDTF